MMIRVKLMRKARITNDNWDKADKKGELRVGIYDKTRIMFRVKLIRENQKW